MIVSTIIIRTGKTLPGIFLLMCMCCFVAPAQELSIIPIPVSQQIGSGNFELTTSTVIVVPAKQPEVQKISAYLSEKIKPATGIALKSSENPSGNSTIQFVLNEKADARLGKEGYSLEITASKVLVTANAPAGIFYGVQTFLQLLPKEIESSAVQSQIKWQVPVVAIKDYPRFAWRGIMLDVSRHFFSKNYVKEYIEQLARSKFNRFHFHLTDDNGWRVEIKSLPKLTEVGAWRVPRTGTFGSNDAPRPGEAPTDGGFYTQDDIREIVQFAKDRYIEIIPEIDVPGHSMAAIAAYPELCVTKDPSIKVNPGSSFSKWFGTGSLKCISITRSILLMKKYINF
jgi:hexosaminidase